MKGKQEFLFFFIGLMLLSFLPLQRGYAYLIDPAEQLEREQQQRKTQEELFYVPQKVKVPEDKGMRFKPFKGCLQIDSVKIIGGKSTRDLLNKKEKEYILPYLRQCISSQKLNDLLIKLNSFLFVKGYVTTRLEIEKYDKKTKELTIKIQKGYIEKFETAAVNRYTIFPGLVGKELRIQDLDQGLAQLNRLPSQYSITTLWPGEQIGGTVVKVDTKKIDNPYRFFLSFDNTGYKRTGQNVLKGNFSYDNLFSLNDQLSLAGLKSGLGRGRSAAVTWREEVPLGYYTIGYSGGYSDSRFDIQDIGVIISGLKNKFNLARIIYRTLSHCIYLDTSLWHYVHRIEIGKSYYGGMKRELNAFEVSVHYDYYHTAFRMLNELNYTQGTRLFGATKDPSDLSHQASHNQFRRYKLTSDYLWKIMDRIQLNGNVQLQYAEQGLSGIVKLPVLDEISGIRGIKKNTLMLDDGVIIRHDLAFPVFLSSVFVPFLHGDIGWARDKGVENNFERYSAVGGGVKLNYLGFNAQGTISKLIDKSAKAEIKREGWVVLFELSQKIL